MPIFCRGISEEEKNFILSNFQYENGTLYRNGSKCGHTDKDGYLVVKAKGRAFKAHRIIWLLTKGEFPTSEIDHIDRNKQNNSIENLRLSNRREQNRNKDIPVNKDTGVAGVHIDKATKGLRKRYTFRYMGKTYRSYTLEEALEVKHELLSHENSTGT